MAAQPVLRLFRIRNVMFRDRGLEPSIWIQLQQPAQLTKRVPRWHSERCSLRVAETRHLSRLEQAELRRLRLPPEEKA